MISCIDEAQRESAGHRYKEEPDKTILGKTSSKIFKSIQVKTKTNLHPIQSCLEQIKEAMMFFHIWFNLV